MITVALRRMDGHGPERVVRRMTISGMMHRYGVRWVLEIEIDVW